MNSESSGAQRPTVRLLRMSRLAAEALGAVTAEVDLTLDQWLVLELLVDHRDTGLAMSEIKSETALVGATLTRTVDKLVTGALAHREVDAHDRRRVVIHAARDGVALHARTVGAVDAAETAVTNEMASPL